MTNGQVILSATTGAMLYGAIGGFSGEGSSHPIIRGALVSGAVGALFTSLYLATRESSGGQLSAPPARLRFP